MLVITKSLLVILCVFFQLHRYPVNAANIAILLAALILTSLPMVIKRDFLGEKGLRTFTDVIWTVYLVLALFIPEMRCYIPLAVIDVCGLRLIVSGIIGCVCVVLEFAQAFILEKTVSNGVFLVLLLLCAMFMQYVVRANEKYAHELKRIRDESREYELYTEEKNRRLREQQDAEIYMATLKERNRIAREIHDNVGHMLTRSILQVGAIKTINSNEALKEPLEGLHETLNTAMTNIRVSVHDLHDESIDLRSAIREITDAVPEEKLGIRLDYDMGSATPRSIKYCFISIIKEAVNNTLKHSNATHMDILVQEHPAFYQLLIQDNGTGIILNHSEGIGLTNMKERIKALHGNMKISTEDGFRILISIIKSNLPETEEE